MRIVNIGILAHVDAGKTTLTESILYTSGAIEQLGSVDKGTTTTDSMLLEKQRGITIQASVTSFQWKDVKINIVDTPGHMDFLAEVQRSLSVLDGAVLVISARDGVQAQTRVLFQALQKMKIPTIFFINKLDQAGIDLEAVYSDIREKLSPEIVVEQRVDLSGGVSIEEADPKQWDPVIAADERLMEKFVLGTALEKEELELVKTKAFQKGLLFPVYHGSAKQNLGTDWLMDAIGGQLFLEAGQQKAGLCGRVFKVEYPKKGQRLVYLKLDSGALHLKDTVTVSGRKEKQRISEMRVPVMGELRRVPAAYPGEIVILPDVSLRLFDVIGEPALLVRERWDENPIPMMQASICPEDPKGRGLLLEALTEIADTDPLLSFSVDSMSHEITLSFLGKVQMEIISALLEEKYQLSPRIGKATVIYRERPAARGEHTIHMFVKPNPFYASVGLSVTPLPLGSGVQCVSHVTLGYLNQSFQNAVMEGIRQGCEQGPCGWEVVDCRVCFEYGRYSSPVSTPSDFRLLTPIVMEQALEKCKTELLEPYLAFCLYTPQHYILRAYSDMRKFSGSIESVETRGRELMFTGEIPARCIQEFREELALCTNGLGVCMTELKGYYPAKGRPVYRKRRPNDRVDKTRHMFRKMMEETDEGQK